MTQPLFKAIDAFDAIKVKELLCRGVDPNEIKYEFLRVRPLHAAIVAIDEGGPIETLYILIGHGADLNLTYPDVGGGTPLLVALSNNLLDVANILIEVGADPNCGSEEGETPLCWSVENRNYEVAKILIGRGAWKTIDSYTAIEGRSALGMAVRRLDVEMVKLLLDAGASITARDFDRNNVRKCLPPINKSDQKIWHEIATLLDSSHITPLMK